MPPEVANKVEDFFQQYPLREYPKGQILIFGNEQPDCVFYLIKGKVKCYDISERGDEVILNLFKPPAFFPMNTALNDTPNRYFFETEVPTTLRCAPVKATVEFLQANPEVALDLLKRLYRGMDGLLGRLSQLMIGTARTRLVNELLLEAARFGKATVKGTVLSISEKDLAARAGLSRETVNRELHKLKAEQLVVIGRADITLPNPAQLATTNDPE